MKVALTVETWWNRGTDGYWYDLYAGWGNNYLILGCVYCNLDSYEASLCDLGIYEDAQTFPTLEEAQAWVEETIAKHYPITK